MSGLGQVTWDAARAGGVVALVLLTASVAAGLLLGLRVASPRWPRFLTSELHGFLSMATLAFVAVHVAAVWLDPFTRFGVAEVLVPFASHYRPLWMGLGIVALDLVLAVWITTRLRARIGYARWKRIHFVTYGIYGAALVHGLGTGTDSRAGWAQAVYLGSALIVGGLAMTRILAGTGHRPLRQAGAATVVAVALAALVWAGQGPLRPGWNARANDGNGSGARGAAAVAPVARATIARAPADPFGTGFHARLVGLVRQSEPDGAGAVTIRLGTTLRRRPAGLLEIMLHGVPLPGGGVQVSDTAVLLGPSPARPDYTGTVTELDGNDIVAEVSRPGAARRLRIRIVLDPITGPRVSGSADARPIPS